MAALGFLKHKKATDAAPQPVHGAPARYVPARIRVVRPILSEKATRAKDEHNAYVFQISRDANKIAVAREIESWYKVHVIKVETIKVPRKPKRTGRSSGYRSGYRKAIVHLKKGEKIDLV